MEPPSGMWGMAAFVTRKSPVRFASMTRRHSSSGYSSIGTRGPRTPALLTSTSILPKRSTVAPTSLSTSALLDTSAASARTSAPAYSASPATGRTPSSLRELIATRAPSRAKASASALPSPWLAPVTSATLPSSISLPPIGLPVSDLQLTLSPAQPWVPSYRGLARRMSLASPGRKERVGQKRRSRRSVCEIRRSPDSAPVGRYRRAAGDTIWATMGWRAEVRELIAQLEQQRSRLELVRERARRQGGPEGERLEAQATARLREIGQRIDDLRASLE